MEPSHNLDLHQATLGAIGAIGATILINLLPISKYSSLTWDVPTKSGSNVGKTLK